MRLYEAYKEIIDGEDKVYVLEGNTGSGKTALINVLKNEHEGRCAVITCETVIDEILFAGKKRLAGEGNFELLLLEYTDRFQEVDFICIDDCEAVYGKEAITYSFEKIIEHIKKTHTVVLTCRSSGWLLEKLGTVKILPIDDIPRKRYGITNGTNTEQGYVSAAESSVIMALITCDGILKSEELCEFYSTIRLGDSLLLQGKWYEAGLKYIGEWMHSIRMKNTDCKVIAVTRYQTARYFESNRASSSLKTLHILMKDVDSSSAKTRYLALRDKILDGEIDYVEYCFMLVEELI